MRALLLALGVGLMALIGGGMLPDQALASSGTLKFSPDPRITAWNANAFTVEIRAENIVTTTMCSTNPENPGAPTAPCGLGAFDFTVTWEPLQFTWNPLLSNFAPGSMLTSTGRSIVCFDPVVASGSARYQCVTFGTSPGLPLGPQGNGSLAFLTLDPVNSSCCPTLQIHFSDVRLFDIQGNQFPGTGVSGNVKLAFCLDVAEPPDGGVDLADTLAILARFGSFVPPEHPKYDANIDGAIDLVDALWSLQQFGQACQI